MTAKNLIDGAYELIGELSVGVLESAAALITLNDMIFSWKLEPLIPFHSGFTSLSSTLSKREYAQVIKFNLAIILAQKEGESISQRVQTIAREGLKSLKNDSASKSINKESKLDSYLTHTLRR